MKYSTLAQRYQADISPEMRKLAINGAEYMMKNKIKPLEVYLFDCKEGFFLVSLANRPPKAFVGEKPLDMDTVFKVEVRKK